jgi:DNA-binding transcriptional LysR family regulator
MIRFTLKQAQVFVAVGKTGSVSHAAQQLSLSQSAASTALSELEKHYQCRLFDRIGKRLYINGLGEVLMPKAVALLDQALAMDQLLSAQSEVGAVKVAASLTVGNYHAPRIVAAFMKQYPEGRITLRIRNTEAIVRDLLAFELDLGLIEAQVQHGDLITEPWLHDTLVLFAAPSHPIVAKSRGGRLSAAEMVEATWVLREAGSGTRTTFERALAQALGHVPQLKAPLVLDQSEAIKQAVIAGVGLGCMSSLAVTDDFAQGRLVPLSLPGLDLRRDFFLVWHREKYLARGMEAFLALCRGAVSGVA